VTLLEYVVLILHICDFAAHLFLLGCGNFSALSQCIISHACACLSFFWQLGGVRTVMCFSRQDYEAQSFQAMAEAVAGAEERVAKAEAMFMGTLDLGVKVGVKEESLPQYYCVAASILLSTRVAENLSVAENMPTLPPLVIGNLPINCH
jgi:non-canonical (house-cleaning) NTP pyrophosphatase